MDDSIRLLPAIISVTIFFVLISSLLYWLRYQLEKQIKREIENIKKYSKNGVWEGEKIPIDPKNFRGNVKKGFRFFHPITHEEFFCPVAEKAPNNSEGSYVQAMYSVNGEGKVSIVYKAHLSGVPSYYYLNVGIG